MTSFNEKLKGYNPPGFIREIDWSMVCAVWIRFEGLSQLGKLTGLYYLRKSLRLAFFDEYQYEISGNGDKLSFYGIFNYREDHKKTYVTWARNIEDLIYILPVEAKKYSFISGIKYIFMITVWIIYGLCKGLGCNKAMLLTFPLLLCLKESNILEQSITESTKLFITYYDASPDENYAIQYAKIKGLITATLQHGIFVRKEPEKEITDTAFELIDSISDYYLAWNEYTKREWIKNGLDSKRIVVCGIPRYIHYDVVEEKCRNECGIFGVILNNSAFQYHNEKLLTIAERIAVYFNMKYVVRFHPELKKEMYSQYINAEHCLGESSNIMAIKEYADEVDFTIISSSSVLVDLTFLGKKAYRLVVSENDTYADIDKNSFHDLEEFVRIHGEINNDKEVFKLLCGTRKIKKSYNEILKLIIEGHVVE